MGKVIPFTGVTRLDLDPDTCLENLKGKLSGFIISGFDVEGNEFFSSTFVDAPDALWAAERFQRVLFENVENNDE